MRRSSWACATALVALIGCLAPLGAIAQSVTLRVMGSENIPLPYATVFVQGGNPSITNDKGELGMGVAKHKILTLEVRRIGYGPWNGKLEIPDTAAVLTVVLPRLAQQLAGVTVTGHAMITRLEQSGFYDRWLMRQKGTLSAVFIGPEEIEKRHPARVSDLFNGLSGVSLMRTDKGSVIAKSSTGSCYMAILLDGQELCPSVGCHTVTGNGGQLSGTRAQSGTPPKIDDITVNLNQFIEADNVVGVEVYARGGNMPVSLQASDPACGVIAIWTGPRR